MSKPYSDFWLEVFGNGFAELQLLVPSTVFMKNIFFEKSVFFHSLLLILSGTSPDFWLNFTAELTKMHFYMSKRTIDGKETYWKNTSYSKTTDCQRFDFEIWQEASTELPKLHIICQINILRKNIFFEQKFTYRSFFELRVKSFGRIFQTISDVFRGSFLKKRHFFSKNHVFSRLMQEFLPNIW